MEGVMIMLRNKRETCASWEERRYIFKSDVEDDRLLGIDFD